MPIFVNIASNPAQANPSVNLHPFKRILLLTLLWLLGSPVHAAKAAPAVAAAASLRDVLPVLADAFSETGGIRPRFSFGASGNLRRQISQGAPFELFLSADEQRVLDLDSEGLTEGAGAVYALGRLAILVRKGSPVSADANLSDLAAALDEGRLGRLAIANPDHAPYGRAAREVLQGFGLWRHLQPHLAVGENVSQAAQYAATGAASAGITAYSLARSPRLAECCDHAPIAAELHAPLRQRCALIRGAGEDARDFYAFLLGPRGRTILREHGYGLPGEAD